MWKLPLLLSREEAGYHRLSVHPSTVCFLLLGDDVVCLISMEMSPNTDSTSLLPWSLWLLLFLLTPITQTTSSGSKSETLLVNTTLLFDGGSPGHNLRNCSCSLPIQDCDEALANSLCSCHTVLRSVLPGLREPGPLTVWVKEVWILKELNRSMIGHLRLSFCGINPVDSQYLAVLGLQTLRIHSRTPAAPFPNQEITISHAPGSAGERETLSFDFASSLHVTFLDVAVMNGRSSLKAYSVIGPPAPTLSQYFPHLALKTAIPDHEDTTDPDWQAAETLRNMLITFVY